MSDFESENENQTKIKTICEFLFFDQFHDNATFPRFEQCFQPLFNNLNISMETIFKEICGPKKKYITYRRFAKAYLKHMEGKFKSVDTETFFDTLFDTILKVDNTYVGKNTENTYTFSTVKTCKNRENVSMIQVLSDKDRKIHGINIEYDGIYKSEMFPKNLEEELAISLEMEMKYLDKKKMKESMRAFSGVAKQEKYMDAVTHIFGTINEKSGYITFLGFKCISGKTLFVGYPEGEGFLFGKYGSKFHDIKIQMKKEGITKLEPIFNKENSKKNFFLKKITGKLLNQNLNEPEIIKDEEALLNLKDEEEIDKMITTPIVEDNHFFNKKLKDEISGSDYKEVVNQGVRNWLLKLFKNKKPKKQHEQKAPLVKIADALQRYEEEKLKSMQKSYNFLAKKISQPQNISKKMAASSFVPEIGKKSPMPKNPLLAQKQSSIIMELDEEDEEEEENEKEDTPLHKTKMYKQSNKNIKSSLISESFGLKISSKIWDGKTDEKAEPNIFLNKKNYLKLKEKFGNMIRDELKKNVIEKSEEEQLLNMIIPLPGRKHKSTKEEDNFKKEIFGEPLIKIKQLDNEVAILDDESFKMKKIDENSKQIEKNEDIQKSEKTVVYSDASQFWNNINKLDNSVNPEDIDKEEDGHGIHRFRKNKGFMGNVMGFFGLSSINDEKKEKEKEKSKKKKDKKNNNYIKKEEEMLKVLVAQNNWQYLRKTLEKINGIYLLQTIGTIIKAKNILDKKSDMPINKKMQLYKLIEENEKVIELIQGNIAPEKQDTDFYELLIPDEHPENITDLSELEKDLSTLKQLLQEKNIKKEDRNKIDKLYNLYLQQKNILIENMTRQCKEQLVSKNDINIEKYLKEEQEKRNKAQEDENKCLGEEIAKIKLQTEKSKNRIMFQSFLIKKVETRIFLDQKNPNPSQIWKDNLFPPIKKSLCPYNDVGWILPEDSLEEDLNGWENADWSRAREIDGYETHSVFLEGATVDDIQQGNIGDCYFFSAVGALCNYPDFFEKIFHTKEKTEENAYGIYFYISGKWKLVLVDDHFPIVGKTFKKFLFSRSVDNELWVSLIEKAWAKLNGYYANISNGGLCCEVFTVLSEAYTEHFEFSNFKDEEVWKKMEDSTKKNYAMTAGTIDENQTYDLEEVGLCYSHAYTVIRTYTIETKRGKERLIKLKNPWGNTEFNGDWSDYSKKWTADLKKQCDFSGENGDDGIFYMSFQDFFKYFFILDIAKIEEGYCSTYFKIKKTLAIKCQVIQLIVEEDCPNTYIQLYQKNERIIKKDGTKHPKPAQCFILVVNSDYKYINSINDKNSHVAVNVDLKAGKYYIFCDVDYRNETAEHKTYGYTVTFYSKSALKNLKNVTEEIDVIKGLEICMYNYCKENFTPTSHKSGMKIYQSQNFIKKIPFILFCYENTTKNTLKVQFDIINENDRKPLCIYSDKIACEFDMSVIKKVKPGNYTIILIWEYYKKRKYKMTYQILNDNDLSTYERIHPVFKGTPRKIDKNGYLLNYYLKAGNGCGYSIGLENTTDKEFELQLKLSGAYDIDFEYREKEDLVFKILPKSRKVFNIRIKPGYKECTFEFGYKK